MGISQNKDFLSKLSRIFENNSKVHFALAIKPIESRYAQ